jgi:hypothetical protein
MGAAQCSWRRKQIGMGWDVGEGMGSERRLGEEYPDISSSINGVDREKTASRLIPFDSGRDRRWRGVPIFGFLSENSQGECTGVVRRERDHEGETRRIQRYCTTRLPRRDPHSQDEVAAAAFPASTVEVSRRSTLLPGIRDEAAAAYPAGISVPAYRHRGQPHNTGGAGHAQGRAGGQHG